LVLIFCLFLISLKTKSRIYSFILADETDISCNGISLKDKLSAPEFKILQLLVWIRDRGVTCTDIVKAGAVKEDPGECVVCLKRDLSPSKCGIYKNIKNNYIYRLKEKLELLEIGTIIPAGNRLRHDGWKIRYFDDIRAAYRRPPADLSFPAEAAAEQGTELV
jgi:hypothetical protein